MSKFLRRVSGDRAVDIAMRAPLSDDVEILANILRVVPPPSADPAKAAIRAQRRLEDIAALLPQPSPHLRYLDVGAGDGSITAAVAQRLGIPPERAVAADLYLPKTINPSTTHVRVGTQELPFEDQSFGLITAFMSAHHFADAPRTFAEVYRVSRPGARLILREHGRNDSEAALYYDAVYETAGHESTPLEWVERYARGGFAHYRTPDEWVALVTDAGFELLFKGTPRRDAFDTVLLAFVRK